MYVNLYPRNKMQMLKVYDNKSVHVYPMKTQRGRIGRTYCQSRQEKKQFLFGT